MTLAASLAAFVTPLRTPPFFPKRPMFPRHQGEERPPDSKPSPLLYPYNDDLKSERLSTQA